MIGKSKLTVYIDTKENDLIIMSVYMHTAFNLKKKVWAWVEWSIFPEILEEAVLLHPFFSFALSLDDTLTQ